MAVTGLSECCNNFKQVLVATSHTRTVQPAALKAIGKARSTPVTGPEWPVKVQTGVVGEPVNHDLMLFTLKVTQFRVGDYTDTLQLPTYTLFMTRVLI